jgi:hypothetical protein
MKYLIVCMILSNQIFAKCTFDSTQFGIPGGTFDYSNRIERALNLRSFEEPGVWLIRIFKVGAFPPAKVIDIVQGLKSTHFCVYDSIYLIDTSNKINKKRLKTKDFSLLENEMKTFQDTVKSLNVETMYNLDSQFRIDGSRFYLTKMILFRYNMFTYYWSEECSQTRQHRFISYISRLVKEKTGIDF